MKLYPFQKVVVDKFERTPSILIGDDMGLGKTVEAIALDLRRRTTQLQGYRQSACKTLIISPLSVLSSWERHIKTLWPAANVAVINPKNRDDLVKKLSQPYHYYVIHWDALRLMPELAEPTIVRWWHVIADEVHRAKNRQSQQTVALKKIKTSYKTALSGTPADNAPQDLWSVLNWLYPRIWTSYWSFFRYFVKIQAHTAGHCMAEGCDKNHKRAFRKVIGVGNVEELHAAIEPYYLRRQKEEVLEDLPDKYYTTIEVELQPRQRRIYNQMRDEMLAWVGKHDTEPVAAPIIVAQLTRLKQFALAFAEIITVNKWDNIKNEMVMVRKVKLSEPSSKLDALMELIEDHPDKKFVVFSESKQIIELLCTRLIKAKVAYVSLTGDTPQSQRPKIIDEFQFGDARIFAGTIQAGGEGITLTASSTVVFLDRTWNPSKNKQAEDRCHRIGQQNAVEVIDIVAKDTVDGGRLQQIKLKWSWLRMLLGDKNAKVELEEAIAS